MKNKRAAMSMVEIMIGVVLLALIIIPSLNVISSQTQTVTATRNHSQAAFVAQKIQEILRSYNFRLIEADQYSAEPEKQKKTFEWKIKNDDELRKHKINGIDYLIDPAQTRVDPVINSLEGTDQQPTAYLVAFVINYKAKDGRQHRLNISTAISMRE